VGKGFFPRRELGEMNTITQSENTTLANSYLPGIKFISPGFHHWNSLPKKEFPDNRWLGSRCQSEEER